MSIFKYQCLFFCLVFTIVAGVFYVVLRNSTDKIDKNYTGLVNTPDQMVESPSNAQDQRQFAEDMQAIRTQKSREEVPTNQSDRVHDVTGSRGQLIPYSPNLTGRPNPADRPKSADRPGLPHRPEDIVVGIQVPEANGHERSVQLSTPSVLQSDGGSWRQPIAMSAPVQQVVSEASTQASPESGPAPSPAANNDPAPDVAAQAEVPTDIRFYDLSNLRGRDSVEHLPGWGHIDLITVGEIWPANANLNVIPYDKIRYTARKQRPEGTIVCLDVEHWPVDQDDDTLADIYIDLHIQLIREFRKHLPPGTKVGYYGVLPIRDYWSVVRNDRDAIRDWERKNERLMRLADEVDIIFPSIYDFYGDAQRWRVYAEHHIVEAEKYGKPVIPFICPVYHPSNPDKGGQPLDEENWQLMLDYVATRTDGAVVWSIPEQLDHPVQDWWTQALGSVHRYVSADAALMD